MGNDLTEGDELTFLACAPLEFYHLILEVAFAQSDAHGTAYQIGVVEFNASAFVAVVKKDGYIGSKKLFV
jgi:hypothetical protein